MFDLGEQERSRPRILFSSPWGPYPKRSVEEDPIDYFYYRNTLKQGIFQLRSFQSWHPLHFLAQNLPVHSTVLENPSPEEFKREVSSHRYQVIAISFTQLLLGKVADMARWLKQEHPEIELVVGGYGTSVFQERLPLVEELRGLCDQICKGEGLTFFRRYLNERWQVPVPPTPLTQNLVPSVHSLFRTRLPLFRQLVLVAGLGCTHGCSFCATSHHFRKKHIPLFQGEELFEAIQQQSKKYPEIQSAVIYDEDFLARKENIQALKTGFENQPELRNRPLLLTVFGSLNSLQQHPMEDLVAAGIGTIYVGVESFTEDILASEGLVKRKGDVVQLFEDLHRNGINTLGSLIVGWDGQSAKAAEEDARRFVQLNPTFYQVVPLHPAPGTPLWDRLKNQGRLREEFLLDENGIGDFNFHLDQISRPRARAIVSDTYTGLVEEGGPWPFRLAENLINGHLNLRESGNPVMQERAWIYWKLLKTILPAALLSGLLFRGTSFWARHRRFCRKLRRRSPGLFLQGWLAALALAPGLFLVSVWGRLKFDLSPLGDQPDKIRRNYHPCPEKESA